MPSCTTFSHPPLAVPQSFTHFLAGHITLLGNMDFTGDSDLNGDNPQFILTCISTGGSATTVTWTRDYDTVTEGTKTMLDNGITAEYSHTLTVTGRQEGRYTCTVDNDVSDAVSSELNVEGDSTTINHHMFSVSIVNECMYSPQLFHLPLV